MTELSVRDVFRLQKFQLLPIRLHMFRVTLKPRGTQRHTRFFNPVSPSSKTPSLRYSCSRGNDTLPGSPCSLRYWGSSEQPTADIVHAIPAVGSKDIDPQRQRPWLKDLDAATSSHRKPCDNRYCRIECTSPEATTEFSLVSAAPPSVANPTYTITERDAGECFKTNTRRGGRQVPTLPEPEDAGAVEPRNSR